MSRTDCCFILQLMKRGRKKKAHGKRGLAGGRSWIRTKDLLGVNETL